MMRSANPVLNDKVFAQAGHDSNSMTISGTVNKSFILLGILMSVAYYTWIQIMPSTDIVNPSQVNGDTISKFFGWVIGGAIGTLIIALIISFKKTTAPYLAPIYAACEGFLLAVISAGFELKYPGIAFQAISLTMAIFLALLITYKSGLIKATENFKLGVAAATGGIFIVYIINFIMGFFGHSMSFLHSSSPLGIGISVFIVIIAALNLVLDFDFIENGEKSRAPKYMEWYASFALLVTLIWLYLEILRLLAKLRDRK